jgi:beta-xylosidase
MRDPCIVQGPDGTFHLVWTDSWDNRTIGYASSKDLIGWSPQKAIPVMEHEPTTRNCWAPEVVYDPARECFMIFWASTIPGRFPETWFEGRNDNNHRIYATTTRDFESFTPAELFFDPGFNTIDSTLLARDGKVYMVFKDETKHPTPMKNLRLAVADQFAGPYQVRPDPINPPGAWVEGPTTLRIGEDTYLYFDVYTRHRYAGLRSRDLVSWEDISSDLVFPEGTRHGTAFEVSGSVLRTLLDVTNDSAARIVVDTAEAGVPSAR